MITRTTLAPPAERRTSGESEDSLLVMSAEAFASLPLPRTGMVILGRSTKCDVQVDDPLASRRHARLHMGERLEIEDLQSANRTLVRDVPITPGLRVPLARGEAIAIGSTVLVVERTHRAGAPRRIWSHRFFEARLREECGRLEPRDRTFALVRLQLEKPIAWVKVVPLLDRDVAPPHLFAAYGPNDYEILLFDLAVEDAAQVTEQLRSGLQELEVPSRAAIAWYPRDGRTSDALVARANSLLRGGGEGLRPALPAPVTLSDAMRPVHDLATRAARCSLNVLILGETGVGKEVMAQMIHRLSARAAQPFLPINCAGLREGLLESELFGYEKGAFTGAVQSKKGLFEVAQGGTLFLDEIGEMPLEVQARVLRAIANREILPLGALKARPTNVRIVAATNRDLVAEVTRGSFRRDLYYRLEGITLTIPPLRERRAEIPGLTAAFLTEAASRDDRSPPALSPAAQQVLARYDWPGNIRQLRNVIERAVVLCDGDTIHPEHLSLEVGRPGDGSEGSEAGRVPPGLSPEEEEERKRMLALLEANVWNQSRAAKALGMPRRTFVAKLDRYGIPRPQKSHTPPQPSEEREPSDPPTGLPHV
jgi:two-component system, NtrC family, response regulator AtoC